MQTYLEIDVPLYKDAGWFKALKTVLDSQPVRWQNGSYHITLAFIDDNPNRVNLIPVFINHLSSISAIRLLFDKIDAFTDSHHKDHIINLTATSIPVGFLSIIEAIRSNLKDVGCILNTDFKLHVTLGRLEATSIDLESLKSLINQVNYTPFSLLLTDVHFKVKGSKKEPLFSIKLNDSN